MSLSIHPLDLGDLELDVSFVNWQTGCGTKFWAPTTAWLILGAERPILVDSSFRSVEDALSNQGLAARRSQQQTLDHQLHRHGLNSADIGYLSSHACPHGPCRAGYSAAQCENPAATQRAPKRCSAEYLSCTFL